MIDDCRLKLIFPCPTCCTHHPSLFRHPRLGRHAQLTATDECIVHATRIEVFPILYLAVHIEAGTLCDCGLFEEKKKQFKMNHFKQEEASVFMTSVNIRLQKVYMFSIYSLETPLCLSLLTWLCAMSL